MRISSVLYLNVHHDVFSGWDLTLDDEKIVTKCVDCFDAFQKELECGQHWLAIVDTSANNVIMPADATADSLMQQVVHAVRATTERADVPLLFVLASDAAFESLAALVDTSCADYLIAPVSRTAYFARLKLFREIRRIKTAETESKAALSRKNVFLAMLSHELRNPLAPMRNALKVLEFIKLSPSDEMVVSQMNEVMNRQVSHMCRLLDDLLDMSRIVDLPRVEASSQDGRLPISSDDAFETKRILIVEDNVDAAMTLQMILNKWGYQTTIAHTGTEAIKLAVEFKPFAVVCDIGLPELDGYQVATVLRRILGHSLSMIAVSGYGQREDKERAIAAGFDDHLVKPANLVKLQQFLETTSVG